MTGRQEWHMVGSKLTTRISGTRSWLRDHARSVGTLLIAATLIVSIAATTASASAPRVTLQPVDMVASPGQPAAFYAAATASPSPTVRWQVRPLGAARFTDIPKASSFAYRFLAQKSMNGSRYRAVFTNVAGRVWSATAVLTVRPGLPGPFVELIFSRSMVTAADVCVRADTAVARLDSTVKPYLASLGQTATGSVLTAPTMQSANYCNNGGKSLNASWDQLTALSAAGWTFVDHSSDYPAYPEDWAVMSARQMWAETCGSAQVIDAHRVQGAADMYLWPNVTGQPGQVNQFALRTFVEPCFGTSRFYGNGVTTGGALAVAPYRQSVASINGGSCNVLAAPCSTVAGAPRRYSTPNAIIAAIKALRPGQVLTLQVFLLVTDTNPRYAHSSDRWDCTSSDPNLHWTNNTERYCWSDFQRMLSYLALSGRGITQPGTVNAAFGRTGYSDRAVPEPPPNAQ